MKQTPSPPDPADNLVAATVVDEPPVSSTSATTPPPAANPLPPTSAESKTQPVQRVPVAEQILARRRTLAQHLAAAPSWLASMVLHAGLLLVLAWLTLPQPPRAEFQELVVAPVEDLAKIDEMKHDPGPEVDAQALDSSLVATQLEAMPALEQPQLESNFRDLDAAPMRVEFQPFGDQVAPKTDLLSKVGVIGGRGLEGRISSAARAAAVKSGGGNAASERSVALALQWFSEHQNADGSWSFDHRHSGSCRGRCEDPGSLQDAKIAGTAMALLPFLGAGQTHKEGKYKDQIAKGLYFLRGSMKVSGPLGSLMEPEGRMYSHGLASIVLCEAYAMTQDRTLMGPAQQSINFIVFAQDPSGGGWRYEPKQRGDTSVVGWQIMALKSAHMAYLRVPPQTIKKADEFLNSVQTDTVFDHYKNAKYGASYGYTSPARKDSTSAIGLLCRMLMGWNRDNPGLIKGVQLLSESGPSTTDMYYNYYATQLMHHMEGEAWEKWNKEMRDYLIKTQSQSGHQTGSWWMNDPHGADRGGRLYCTSLATMILEVYYRQMPLYRQQSTEDDFPVK